jgi:hypothetical protein
LGYKLNFPDQLLSGPSAVSFFAQAKKTARQKKDAAAVPHPFIDKLLMSF